MRRTCNTLRGVGRMDEALISREGGEGKKIKNREGKEWKKKDSITSLRKEERARFYGEGGGKSRQKGRGGGEETGRLPIHQKGKEGKILRKVNTERSREERGGPLKKKKEMRCSSMLRSQRGERGKGKRRDDRPFGGERRGGGTGLKKKRCGGV